MVAMMTFALLYTWMKALHVAAATLFVVGVSVLSLVLVADAPLAQTTQAAQNKPHGASPRARMRRWNGLVTTPAMLLTWALGIGLATQGHWWTDAWLGIKLGFVVLLSAIHGVQSRTLRRRAAGQQAGVWRLTPLIVATATLAILGLAVAKPF
jgi:uncharacterized membrane protein